MSACVVVCVRARSACTMEPSLPPSTVQSCGAGPPVGAHSFAVYSIGQLLHRSYRKACAAARGRQVDVESRRPPRPCGVVTWPVRSEPNPAARLPVPHAYRLPRTHLACPALPCPALPSPPLPSPPLPCPALPSPPPSPLLPCPLLPCPLLPCPALLAYGAQPCANAHGLAAGEEPQTNKQPHTKSHPGGALNHCSRRYLPRYQPVMAALLPC